MKKELNMKCNDKQIKVYQNTTHYVITFSDAMLGPYKGGGTESDATRKKAHTIFQNSIFMLHIKLKLS